MENDKDEKGLRVSRDFALMMTASVWALRSTCKTANGAIITREGRIIATGYNGAPAGQPHCLEVGCLLDEKGHCQRTVHAEANAIAMAAKYGISTDGTTLYTTMAPCPSCCKLLVNSGIKFVVYSRDYPDMSGIELLGACGIGVTQFIGGRYEEDQSSQPQE